VIFLILPQLPLTLGNSVFAANNACHSFFNKQASRVSDKRLAASVGFSDVFIGLLGGFPACHGAGGIAAHSQFGAKTGGAIIIMGTVFILLALISPLSGLLFLIPVPLLGAMLLFDSYKLGTLITKLQTKPEYAVAVLVAVISFATRNLTIALAAGLLTEFLIKYLKRKNLLVNEKVKRD
jgi:SulP family sulfate permease